MKPAFSNEKIALGALLTTAVVAILALVTGYFVVTRLSRMEEGVLRLEEKVDVMGSQAKQASQEASAARDAAELAARARLDAEAAQAEAELRTQAAREDVEQARAEARQARSEADEIRRQRERELNELRDTLNQIVETRRTALGLVMSLGGESMQFEFNKATLRPENRELLSRIAGILLTLKGYGIYVYGHTDDVGSEQYNQQLSERRAQAVREYLISAGIEAGLITTRGFGKSRPLVAASDPGSRAKNRRVEIGIVQADIKYHDSVGEQR